MTNDLQKYGEIGDIMKATPFGRYIRKLRIDHGVILKDLADALQVSSSYISAVELGKKNISESFVQKLSCYFKIGLKDQAEIKSMVDASQPAIKIDLKDSPSNEREMVMAFARKYRGLSAEQQDKLKQLLEGK